MKKAPSDLQANKAWEKIMQLARDHALVVQGFGGVVTLATPEAQREAGIREKVLRMHRLEE